MSSSPAVALEATPNGVIQDQSGNVLAGRLVYVYVRSTTTQVQVYSDAALSISLSQPLTTQPDGSIPGYVATDVLWDYVDAATGTRTQGGDPTPNGLRLHGDFGVIGDGATDVTSAVEAAIASASAARRPLIIDNGTFICNSAHLLGSGHHIIGGGGTLQSSTTNTVLWLGDGNHPFTVGSGANHDWSNALTGSYKVGESVITLATAGNAAHFAVGDIVWIRCRQTIGGSSNEPIAELNKVRSTDSSTGNIGLAWSLAKDYSDGADGTIYAITKIGTEVVQNVEIEGVTFVNPHLRAVDGTGLNIKIHDNIVTGRGGFGIRGRFIDQSFNRIHLNPDWSAPVWRPYYTAPDTGTADFAFHDNPCTSSGIGILHWHEGHGNVRAYRNTLIQGKQERSTQIGTATLTPGSNVLTVVTNPASYVVGNGISGGNATAQIPDGAKISAVDTGLGTITMVNTATGNPANVVGGSPQTLVPVYSYELWAVVSLRSGSWNSAIEDNTIINSPGGIEPIACAANSVYNNIGHFNGSVRGNRLGGNMPTWGINASGTADGTTDQNLAITDNRFLTPTGIADVHVTDLLIRTKNNVLAGASNISVSNSGSKIPAHRDYMDCGVGELYAASGGPTVAAIGSGRRAGWTFADATTSTVYGTVVIPTSWATFAIDLLWYAPTVTGAATWQFLYASLNAGDQIDVDPDPQVSVTSTASAVTTLVESNITQSFARVAGKKLFFRVSRLGSDAGDTITANVHLHAVRFTPVTVND